MRDSPRPERRQTGEAPEDSSRRQFLKIAAGAAVAGVGAQALLGQEEQENDTRQLADAFKVEEGSDGVIDRILALLDEARELQSREVWHGIGERFLRDSSERIQERFSDILERKNETGEKVGKRVDYAWIRKQGYADGDVNIGGIVKEVPRDMTVSRLELAQVVMGRSHVPSATLKALIPFVPFEESGYRDNQVSAVGATGAWQFMKDTARAHGLAVRSFVDQRRDFISSTLAARRMFEDMSEKLGNDANYQKLREKYSLTGDFLTLACINAFNSGPMHMHRAFAVMANERDSECQTALAQALKNNNSNGDLALFDYLTNEYPKLYVKYQKPKLKKGEPFYYEESSAYAYKVLAFGMLSNPNFTHEPPRTRLPNGKDAPIPEQRPERAFEETTSDIPVPERNPRRTDV